MARINDVVCPGCGHNYDRNRQSARCPHAKLPLNLTVDAGVPFHTWKIQTPMLLRSNGERRYVDSAADMTHAQRTEYLKKLIDTDTAQWVRVHSAMPTEKDHATANMFLLIDDNGRLKNLPFNFAASLLYAGYWQAGEAICGDVVLVEKGKDFD
jgi:hypothetical protein